MTEPPNTEARVDRLKEIIWQRVLHTEDAKEALTLIDAIVSELERLRTMRQHNYEGALADLHAAEAELEAFKAQRVHDMVELERVRAERDLVTLPLKEQAEARLDRAVEALRKISELNYGGSRIIARAALAEIEESG